MRAALIALALVAITLGVHAHDDAAQTLDYDHTRALMADKKCSIDPPRERDYTWLGYKEMNGFAYKATTAVGGFFKTLKGVPTVKACFKACVNARSSPGVCSSFRYEPGTKRCGLSTFAIPFDPTDPRDIATATKWCPKKGSVAGWVISMHD